MLGKLLKYEINSTYKTFLSLFVSVLALSVINKIFMTIGTYDNSIFSFFSVVVIFLYVLIILSSLIISLVGTVQRFYKNLFSSEGYLSFTIPVKPYMHILSKSIVAITWIILNIIVILISISILFMGNDSIKHFFQDVSNYFSFLKLYLGSKSAVLFFCELIFVVIVALLYQIYLAYLSISIGNIFHKHKIFASFSAYILISMLVQIINSFFMFLIFPEYSSGQNLEIKFIIYNLLPLVIIYNLIFSSIFCLSTNYILSKHLNLE